jgi:peptidoglycan/LPS O-acetylase OafA/YrhL
VVARTTVRARGGAEDDERHDRQRPAGGAGDESGDPGGQQRPGQGDPVRREDRPRAAADPAGREQRGRRPSCGQAGEPARDIQAGRQGESAEDGDRGHGAEHRRPSNRAHGTSVTMRRALCRRSRIRGSTGSHDAGSHDAGSHDAGSHDAWVNRVAGRSVHSGVAATSAVPAAPAAVGAQRVAGLDGVRGLAALFVVLNHIFLRAWPGYPADHAPFWAAGFIYGRFAVVVFIALSGFSLGLAPARTGWRFDSIATFARRRAWRILPAYWAALGFSLLMTWYVLAQPGWALPNGRSVLVYGLLVQDAVPAGIPNRAFWSIAIEAQLYVLLPLLLLLVRRIGALAMAAAVGAVVVAVGLLAPGGALVEVTPDLAVLFAIGVLAAGIVTAPERTRSRPWGALALAGAVPVLVLIGVAGATWTDEHLFWVDLAWGPAIGCFLAAVATRRPRAVVAALDVRALRRLGSFSYSLYLTHAPIVIAVSYGLVLGHVAPGTPTFLVLTAVLVPLTVGFARVFAAAFELPFQRHRGWAPLSRAVGARLRRPYSGVLPAKSS